MKKLKTLHWKLWRMLCNGDHRSLAAISLSDRKSITLIKLSRKSPFQAAKKLNQINLINRKFWMINGDWNLKCSPRPKAKSIQKSSKNKSEIWWWKLLKRTSPKWNSISKNLIKFQGNYTSNYFALFFIKYQFDYSNGRLKFSFEFFVVTSLFR